MAARQLQTFKGFVGEVVNPKKQLERVAPVPAALQHFDQGEYPLLVKVAVRYWSYINSIRAKLHFRGFFAFFVSQVSIISSLNRHWLPTLNAGSRF